MASIGALALWHNFGIVKHQHNIFLIILFSGLLAGFISCTNSNRITQEPWERAASEKRANYTVTQIAADKRATVAFASRHTVVAGWTVTAEAIPTETEAEQTARAVEKAEQAAAAVATQTVKTRISARRAVEAEQTRSSRLATAVLRDQAEATATTESATAEAIAKSILATQETEAALSVANEELEEYLRTYIGPGQITGAEAIANIKQHLRTSTYSSLDARHFLNTGGFSDGGERRYIENPCSYLVKDSYVATWNAAPDGPNSWYISAALVEGKVLFGYIVLGWTFYPATLAIDSHHDHETC